MLQHRKLARRVALAAALAAAACPAAAAADSIVYVKEGDVWLTEADGSRQYQVTFDGNYTTVAQADDGAIIAGKQRRLFRLTRTGEVVNEITTAMKSLNWNGPYDLDVSPDGSKVAYGFLYQKIFEAPDCPVGTCGSEVISGVGYSLTSGPAAGVPMHTGWSYPDWLDDERLVHSFADSVWNKESIIRRFGEGNNGGQPWMDHPVFSEFKEATVQGNAMAFAGPWSGKVLAVVHLKGEPGTTDEVDDCFAYQQPSGEFTSVTWAPHGRALAWAESDGIWRGDFADVSDGCDGAPGPAKMLIPGAHSPDWGPAGVPPARPVPPGPGPAGPGAEPPKPPAPAPTPRRRGTTDGATVTVATAKLGRALSKGLTLKVAGASGTVRATARISAATARRARLGSRARTVATGSGAARGGTATVKLRFGKSTARKLRRLRSVPLSISAGGATTSITLRR